MSIRPTVLYKGHGISQYTEIPRPLLALPGCSKCTGVDLRLDGVIRRAPGRTPASFSPVSFSTTNILTSTFAFNITDSDGYAHPGLILSNGQDLYVQHQTPYPAQTISSVGTMGETWRFAQEGSSIYAVNGRNDPFQLVWDPDGYSVSTASYAEEAGPVYKITKSGTTPFSWAAIGMRVYVTGTGLNSAYYTIDTVDASKNYITLTTSPGSGTPSDVTVICGKLAKVSFGLSALSEDVVLTTSSGTGTGYLRQGTYKLRFRGWDSTTDHYTSITAPVTITTTGTDGANKITVDLTDVLTDTGEGDSIGYDTRVTHIDILRTQCNDDIYFLDTQQAVTLGSPYTVDLTQSDTDLAADVNKIVMPSDYVKSLPPNGSKIWNYENILLIAGKTNPAYSGSHTKITNPSWIYFSSPYAEDPEAFASNWRIPLANENDPIVGGVQCGDYFLVFCERSIYRIQRQGAKLVLVDMVQGRGATSQDAICITPYGVVFQAADGLFLTAGGDPFEIGRPIRDWFSGKTVTLYFDPINSFIFAQDQVGYECAVCWINASKQVRWTILKDHPARFMLSCVDLDTAASESWVTYSIQDQSTTLTLKPVWKELQNVAYQGYSMGSDHTQVMGTRFSYIKSTREITPIGWSAHNQMIGMVIRVIANDGGDVESTRVITSISAGKLYHSGTGLNLTTNVTIAIGVIPFEVRFPPMIGTDPFVRKRMQSVHIMGHTLTASQTAVITVKTYTDTVVNTGTDSGGTITLQNVTLNSSASNSCIARCSGQMLEVELQNYAVVTGGFDIYFVQCYAQMEETRNTRA